MRQKFRFTKDFDYRIDTRREVGYRAGEELIIPQAHADAAVAAGVGEFVDAPEEAQKPIDGTAPKAETEGAKPKGHKK